MLPVSRALQSQAFARLVTAKSSAKLALLEMS
jgi:hypothetical protein